MHDGAGWLVDEIDHLGHRRSNGGADDDSRARSDDRALACVVEESPDEAGLVLVVHVGSDIDGGHCGVSIRRGVTPDCTGVPGYVSAAAPKVSSPKVTAPKVFAASACIPGSTCW